MPRLLAGDGSNAEHLRAQYDRATIREIDATGTGYYVHFDVPADAPLADPSEAHGGPVGDAVLESDGIKGGGFLQLDRGRLMLLELFAYDPWPEDQPIRVAQVTPVCS